MGFAIGVFLTVAVLAFVSGMLPDYRDEEPKNKDKNNENGEH